MIFYVFSRIGLGESIHSYPLRQFCQSTQISVSARVMSKSHDLPWFQSGLSFECTQCGNCCSGPGTGYVWVSPEEIAGMANALGMSDRIDEFERKFTRQVGTRVSLVEYSDGDCIFLDPRLRTCTLYDARPTQCRTWPFWKSNVRSPQDWRETAKNCPGCDRGQRYSLDEIQQRLDQ